MFESREDKISLIFLKAYTDQPTNQQTNKPKNLYLLFFFLIEAIYKTPYCVFVYSKGWRYSLHHFTPYQNGHTCPFYISNFQVLPKVKIKSWNIWSDCFHTWIYIPGDKFYITVCCWYYWIRLALYKIFDRNHYMFQFFYSRDLRVSGLL